ncbi:MAG: Asp23/Gls24 family envelope stress response protein [Candidatus Omnitrophica bacterium]|nr:Asp23/Gls24 family envelope stress response protein [Candidatus Omnitrophota bacterium]
MPKNDETHRDRSTELGVVRISNEAISAIASVAAMEVRGVCRMGGGTPKAFIDSLLNRFSSRGVRISMKDGEISLTVFIVVEYGVDIPRVADEVQENVKRAVEKMAGLVPSEVDIVVEGVRPHTPIEKERRP